MVKSKKGEKRGEFTVGWERREYEWEREREREVEWCQSGASGDVSEGGGGVLKEEEFKGRCGVDVSGHG